MRVVVGCLERLDFHFHHVRRVDVGAQEPEGVHLGGFHVERERFLFGSLFEALRPLDRGGLFLVLAGVESQVLLVDLVQHGFYGVARLGLVVLEFVHPEILLHEDCLDLVEHSLALVAVAHRDFLEDAIGKDGRTERTVGVHLEVSDDSLEVTADGEVREFGKCNLFTADNGNRADEAIFGVGTLVLDCHVVGKTLVQHLQNQEGVFLVGELRVKLQLRVRMGQKEKDR